MLRTRRELDREGRGSGVDVGVGIGLELAVVADEEVLLLLASWGPGGRDETQAGRDQQAGQHAPASEAASRPASAWPARLVPSAKHQGVTLEGASSPPPGWVNVDRPTG